MSKGERYSKVSRRIWNDARFRALSAPPPNGQTLWQRLLTGPELTNVPGCFQAWEAGLAQALNWDVEGFRAAFAEVVSQGMADADWGTGFIFVPKAISHNKPESPNVVRSWKATWDELPECALKLRAYQQLKAFLEGLGKAYVEAFREACRKPSGKASPNQEQEQEQEQEDPLAPEGGDGSDDDSDDGDEPDNDAQDLAVAARKVFDFWRSEHRHENAKYDKRRKARILARLKEGFSGRDLCLAIRGAKKDRFLMGENDRGRVYDGIETILRDAAQVEKLRDLVVAVARDGSPDDRQSGTRIAAAAVARKAQFAAEDAAHQARLAAEAQAANGAAPRSLTAILAAARGNG